MVEGSRWLMTLTPSIRRKLVAAALRLRGIPYDHAHRDLSWRRLDARPSALDCSAFICRVALECLEHPIDTLAANAEWLLDNLSLTVDPKPGDLVGYYREANAVERLSCGPLVWHVMLSVGSGSVVGACDLANAVVTRTLVYDEPRLDRWRLIDDRIEPPNPFRRFHRRAA